MTRRRTGQVVLAVLAVWVVAAPSAHAYIDPGSGTLLWQFALAAFFGSLFFVRRAGLWVKTTLKSFWTKIKGSRSA